MALSFNPPEWLIQEYMKQKNPMETASEGVNNTLQTYMQMKALEQQQGLKNQEIQLASAKNAREGRESFYNYGDTAGLPTDVQASLGKPAQGPATAAGVGPQLPPLIERYNQFLAKNPQGIKGREDPAKAEVPLFNEKGQPIKAQTPSGLLPPNAKVIDDAVGRGGQFVGTQGTMGTYWDPNKNAFGQAPLPGGAPLEPRVAPTLPAEQTNKTAELNKFLQDINVIRASYKPEFVGMFDSRKTGVQQATGLGATPEAATFKATVGGLRNKVLNLLSGAAISPSEADRLMATLPNENMSETDFQGKLANFERETNLIMQERASAFGQAGYRNAASMAPDGAQPAQLPAVGSSFQGGKVLSIKRVR